MSDSTVDPSKPDTVGTKHPVKRRGLLIGAGAAGAAVLAAKVLPGAAPVVATAVATEKFVNTSAGYQVTDHVLRYYATART